jgi:hypothetical protein
MHRHSFILVLSGALLLSAATPVRAAHPVAQQCVQPHLSVVFVEEVSASRSPQYPSFYSPGSYSVQHLAPGLGCSIFLERAGVTADSTPALDAAGERVVVDVDADGSLGGSRVLQVFERQAHTPRRLTEPVAAATATVGDYFPSWSPDGGTVLFTRVVRQSSGARTSALYTVPASGGPVQMLPGSDGALSASWHPDGTRVAYAMSVPTAGSRTAPEEGRLVTSGIDGSARTDLGVAGLEPAWAPDGSALAFVKTTDPGSPPFVPPTRRIALLDPGSGAITLLSATGDQHAARGPAWLPDGQSLVYSQLRSGIDGRSEPGGVWTVDRTGLRSGPLYDGAGDERSPSAAGPAPTDVRGYEPSTYVPLDPFRALDSRTTAAALGPGGTVEVQIAGGVVPATATAVALTITVVSPTASTDVRVFPTGDTPPGSSNVNAAAGRTVANAVLVPIGNDGRVRLRNSAGSAHLLVDVAGYYRAGDAGAGFAGSSPRRILDTRSATNVGAPAGKLGPAEVLDLQVIGELPHADSGSVHVPPDATAVVLNLTATGATAATDVRAYPRPNDTHVPNVSNLNLRRGETAATLVTVAVGNDGQVRLRNAGGEVDLVADLAGWYSPTAPGRFVPASPSRLLDTRVGLGAAPLPLAAAELLDLPVAGARGIPAEATHAVLNLTGTAVSATTDVRADAAGSESVPTVSNLNLTPGATRANLAIAPAGTDGGVRLRSSAGHLAIIADIAGWFVSTS